MMPDHIHYFVQRSNDHLISIGTGQGNLYFYDLKANRYLTKLEHSLSQINMAGPSTNHEPSAWVLKTTLGWLVSCVTYCSSSVQKCSTVEKRWNLSRLFQWNAWTTKCYIHSHIQPLQEQVVCCRWTITFRTVWELLCHLALRTINYLLEFSFKTSTPTWIFSQYVFNSPSNHDHLL